MRSAQIVRAATDDDAQPTRPYPHGRAPRPVSAEVLKSRLAVEDTLPTDREREIGLAEIRKAKDALKRASRPEPRPKGNE